MADHMTTDKRHLWELPKLCTHYPEPWRGMLARCQGIEQIDSMIDEMHRNGLCDRREPRDKAKGAPSAVKTSARL